MTDKPTLTLSGTRGEEWEHVLGTRTFVILSPDSEVLHLDYDPDTACVFLDVDALSLEQQAKLIDHLARKSGVETLRTAVRREVYSRGVPIRLGTDARIDLPPGYQAKRKLKCGPDAWDLRFFT